MQSLTNIMPKYLCCLKDLICVYRRGGMVWVGGSERRVADSSRSHTSPCATAAGAAARQSRERFVILFYGVSFKHSSTSISEIF